MKWRPPKKLPRVKNFKNHLARLTLYVALLQFWYLYFTLSNLDRGESSSFWVCKTYLPVPLSSFLFLISRYNQQLLWFEMKRIAMTIVRNIKYKTKHTPNSRILCTQDLSINQTVGYMVIFRFYSKIIVKPTTTTLNIKIKRKYHLISYCLVYYSNDAAIRSMLCLYLLKLSPGNGF